MPEYWPWAVAIALYALFRAWYDNWRGPLTQNEIDEFLREVQHHPSSQLNDLQILRTFFENDDGKEFVMLNLVRVAPGEAKHPTSGELVSARTLMNEYARVFMPALLRRGGHPAIVARKVGGYVDAWHVEPDPGWSIVGFMRYRSRRDVMRLVLDPRFTEAHPFKVAATAETFSFPTQPQLMLFVGPRLWVGLVLALAAALLQLALA